jgi:hypothetical protein
MHNVLLLLILKAINLKKKQLQTKKKLNSTTQRYY